MKITYAKLRITIGKTQVALVVKMNIFGQWLLTNFMAIAIVQIQALPALARNLLLKHLQNQALQNQALQNQALQKLVLAEKHLRNNLYLFLQKIPVVRQVFFVLNTDIFFKVFTQRFLLILNNFRVIFSICTSGYPQQIKIYHIFSTIFCAVK